MKVQETTTITLDSQSYEVAKLSGELQQMVTYLDDWRQKELDLTSELLMTRSGIRDLQGAIASQLQAELKEAREKAEALGLIGGEVQAQESANEAD